MVVSQLHSTRHLQTMSLCLFAKLILPDHSPKWPDGKKHARNVYAHTREECEEKLKVLIVEMKEEIAEMQRLKAEGTLPPRESEKSQKKTKKSKKNK